MANDCFVSDVTLGDSVCLDGTNTITILENDREGIVFGSGIQLGVLYHSGVPSTITYYEKAYNTCESRMDTITHSLTLYSCIKDTCILHDIESAIPDTICTSADEIVLVSDVEKNIVRIEGSGYEINNGSITIVPSILDTVVYELSVSKAFQCTETTSFLTERIFAFKIDACEDPENPNIHKEAHPDVFAPSQGPYHFSNTENGTIEIIDFNGEIIFETYVEAGIPSLWDGTTSEGNNAPLGAYICKFTTTSGKENSIILTIIR